MAVQQNKKSPSRRGMRRAHDFLTGPALTVEQTSGEVHLRHIYYNFWLCIEYTPHLQERTLLHSL